MIVTVINVDSVIIEKPKITANELTGLLAELEQKNNPENPGKQELSEENVKESPKKGKIHFIKLW